MDNRELFISGHTFWVNSTAGEHYKFVQTNKEKPGISGYLLCDQEMKGRFVFFGNVVSVEIDHIKSLNRIWNEFFEVNLYFVAMNFVAETN